MTPEETNIAIAKLCGWKAVKFDRAIARKVHTNPPTSVVGISPAVQTLEHGNDETKDFNYWPIPNYAEDLNATADMEKVLTDEQHRLFRKLLFTGVYNRGEGQTNDTADRWTVSASAQQRCAAFLEVMGVEV